MTMLKFSDIGILADDLTGACDAAACFAPGNGPIAVLVSREHRDVHSVIRTVINTQSRLMKPEEARAVLRSLGKQLSGKQVIFKKIDSALRGPVGAELAGLIEGLGERTIILAPAIPGICRTTKNGFIYDSGVPIHQTPYAGDAASPVGFAHIEQILSLTGEIQCEIPDAESDEDLRRIAEQSLRNIPVVFAGSIGLADALAHMVEFNRWNAMVRPACRVVIVCGSFYSRAREQIQAAADHFGTHVLAVGGTTPVNSRIIHQEKEMPAIIRLNYNGIEQDRMPSGFISIITGKVSEMIREIKPDGLGIIGGETAFHLLRSLGTTRMDVYDRIGEVMTSGILYDGFLTGCRFVTKGGSVGSTDAVVRMIHHLKGTNA